MPELSSVEPQKIYLGVEDYKRIIPAFVDLGVRNMKLTGGEPTVRKDFGQILDVFAQHDVDLSVTSNGQLLHKHLDRFKDAGVTQINISLDTLSADKFKKITKNGSLDLVLRNLYTARDMGFKIKTNAVVFKNVNDEEAMAFHDWSAEQGIEVRFLEVMRIGQSQESHEEMLVPWVDLHDRIAMEHPLTRVDVEKDSTSIVFDSEAGARIGFIASETTPFCGNCSRLRLTAKGVLRPCLMSTEGIELRHLEYDELVSTIRGAIELKPIDRIESLDETMNKIGG